MKHTNDVQLVTNAGWDERVLICRNAPLVDSYIIVSERYVVVVDTMINETTAEKLRSFAEPYLSDHRSLLVVNTHADYDHCWGNQHFAALAVPIIGHRLSVPIFSSPDTVNFRERVQAEEPEIFGAVVPTPPSILLDEKLTIDGGDLTFELFATPGHTVDHLSLYIPEIDILLAGDAAEFPYPMARTASGMQPMRKSLATLAALKAETVLYCHAPVEIGPQLLEDNIAYFDRLEAACRAALARTTPAEAPEGTEIVDWVGLRYQAAVPDKEVWQEVHEHYRKEGHARQLEQMLTTVVGERQDKSRQQRY